jgi:hypothetical protein
VTQGYSHNPSETELGRQPVSDLEARRQRRAARRAARGGRYGSAVIVGIVLVAVGIIALLQDFASLRVGDWGALFVLIPAAAAFIAGWRNYEEAGGRVTGRVVSALVIGLALVAVTVIVFFGLSWELSGPILLIVVGLGFLAGALLPK